MTTNQSICESGYTSKILRIQALTMNYDKNKYNTLLKIFSDISNMFGKPIKYLSDFRHISCDKFQENIINIQKIISSHTDEIQNEFHVELDVSSIDSYKKFASSFNKLSKPIDYVVSILTNHIYVSHI